MSHARRGRRAGWIALLLFASSVSAQGFVALRARAVDFVDRNCVHCHDSDAHEGGIDFEAIGPAPADWLAAARVLRRAGWRAYDGEMPPRSESARPDGAERRDFAVVIEAALVAAAQDVAVDPVAPTLRRLCRAQYRRAVSDLLGVDVDVETFLPEDPSGNGFDVVGDVQSVSPLVFDGYLEATDAILDAEALHGDATGSGCPAEDVESWLRPLLRRAFRRPVSSEALDARTALFRSVIATGADVRLARRRVLQSVLLSPWFLFRVEADDADAPPGSIRALDDHELAARLSFFLWSAPPDDELAALADRGRLRDRTQLIAQVRRMVASPRVRVLADEFAAQWLGFRNILTTGRDVRRYSFSSELRDAAYEEAALSFAHIVRDGRSLLELIDADWTFVDQELAQLYGLSAPEGEGMHLVRLDDHHRGGVLGWAATAIVNAYPTRTSPVLRGRFVLEELCGDPPAPPPAKVGALPEDDRQSDGLSLRQRLELHRSAPQCAACHARMDPFGLALENFDGIGRFRATDEDRPLDPCVVLPGGDQLDGPLGVRQWLLERRARFLRVLAERMFVFALGREAETGDARVIDGMVDAAQRGGYLARDVIEVLCTSDAFLLRRRP